MCWLDAPARVQAVCLAAVLGGALLSLVVFPPQHFAIYPLCPIHAWFGFDCPGCGMTRALASLLHGEVREAARENIFSLPLAVLGSIAIGRQFHSALLLNRWRGTL